MTLPILFILSVSNSQKWEKARKITDQKLIIQIVVKLEHIEELI